MSDGYQSLTFEQFAETMELCRRVAGAVGKTMDPAEAGNCRDGAASDAESGSCTVT